MSNDWPEIRDDSEPEAEGVLDYRRPDLDGLRIRQFAAMKRAAYRSRSHAIVAMLLCAVAAVHSARRKSMN